MTSKAKHTIVVSDVHLSQTHDPEPDDALWMRYRASDCHPDADFVAFVDRILEACEGGAIELVFNGDVLDFDAPLAKNGKSTFEEYPLDDAGCAAHVRRICADHPGFTGAVKKLLAASPEHRVLFTSGNHDLELYWPGVRDAIRDVLGASEERVRFRTWFHVTEDRIYIEHGSQYDMLNGVPDPMVPVVRESESAPPTIKPVAGKLAFKRIGSRMGYFNPYYEETFYLGLSGYLRHFAKHYLFSHRHIFRTWMRGAIATVVEIMRHREPWRPALPEASVTLAVAETKASRDAILATHALRVRSAEHAMLPILRELWLDRIFIILFTLFVLVTCITLTSLTFTAGVAGVLAIAIVAYELLTPKPDIRTYDSAPPSVRQLYAIHGVRAMCMGHTHRPVGTWEDGLFWGNSGAWCPAFVDEHCKEPVLSGRPFLWLTSDAAGLRGGLHWLKGGVIVDDAGREEIPEPASKTAAQ